MFHTIKTENKKIKDLINELKEYDQNSSIYTNFILINIPLKRERY